MFYNCTNMAGTAVFPKAWTYPGSNWYHMYFNCSKINTIHMYGMPDPTNANGYNGILNWAFNNMYVDGNNITTINIYNGNGYIN